MPEQPSHGDAFYVGYLPLPVAHRRALVLILPAIVVVFAVAAAVIGASQRSPGTGVWDIAAEQSWEGTVVMEPYPMLVEASGEGWLLVEVGKRGAHDRLVPFDGASVELRGYPLTREHRRMIEVSPGDSAINRLPNPIGMPNAPRSNVREIEVIAEIVDGKCFLGAMKPGDGKGHKSCAILCLRGGLPPLIAATSDSTHYPLLLVDGSTELPESVLGLVAEPVRIRGTLTTVAGLPVIETTADGITRP